MNVMQYNTRNPHRFERNIKNARTHRPSDASQSIMPQYSPVASLKNHVNVYDHKENHCRRRRDDPRSPQMNVQNRCDRVRARARPRGKGLISISKNVPPIASPESMTKSPTRSPLRYQDSAGEIPRDNDVVCFTICPPKRSKGIIAIQSGSTHQGNLRFCSVVQSYADSYDCSSINDQKRIARLIVSELQSMGGRFVVWIKENRDLIEHKNNGSWHIVGIEDALNISRYVLLKQIEQMNSESAHEGVEDKTLVDDSVQKETSIYKLPETDKVDTTKKMYESDSDKDDTTKKMYESDYSTSTDSSNSIDMLLNILSDIGVDGEEDDLDLWSSSPGGNNKKEKNAKPQLEACCWEYKLLLPLDL